MKKAERPDHGLHRQVYESNRKKILASQSICAICGKPVDKTIKSKNVKGEFNPYAATVDHIIPIAAGGHPSALENLQLAHWICNRQKADKLGFEAKNLKSKPKTCSNRILPLTFNYGGDGNPT